MVMGLRAGFQVSSIRAYCVRKRGEGSRLGGSENDHDDETGCACISATSLRLTLSLFVSMMEAQS